MKIGPHSARVRAAIPSVVIAAAHSFRTWRDGVVLERDVSSAAHLVSNLLNAPLMDPELDFDPVVQLRETIERERSYRFARTLAQRPYPHEYPPDSTVLVAAVAGVLDRVLEGLDTSNDAIDLLASSLRTDETLRATCAMGFWTIEVREGKRVIAGACSRFLPVAAWTLLHRPGSTAA